MLRTPLTTILGSVELLAEEVEAIEDPDLRSRLSRFTAVISRGARRQQALVEDLLALTSIDGGQGLGHQCLADLVVVIENSVAEHQSAAAAGGVRLIADTTARPLLVAANERWVSRALDCLISNAVKFTPAHGLVEVTAGEEEGRAWLEVSDTGPGIPPDEVDRIFGRFYRGQVAVAAEKQGAGLGLAIARSVLESSGGSLVVMQQDHGARLRMESARGVGHAVR